MKISFEFDTEKDNIEIKMKELKSIENLISYHVGNKAFLEGEKWLKSLPDKYF